MILASCSVAHTAACVMAERELLINSLPASVSVPRREQGVLSTHKLSPHSFLGEGLLTSWQPLGPRQEHGVLSTLKLSPHSFLSEGSFPVGSHWVPRQEHSVLSTHKLAPHSFLTEGLLPCW